MYNIYVVNRVYPESLVTFQNLDTLSRRRLDTALRRYPERVWTGALQAPILAHKVRRHRPVVLGRADGSRHMHV